MKTTPCGSWKHQVSRGCLFLALCLGATGAFGQDELLLPLPGSIPKAPVVDKRPSDIILPLPTSIPKTETASKTKDPHILPLPVPPKQENTTMIITPEEPTGEIVIDPSTLTPPPPPPETQPVPPTAPVAGAKNPLPAYPKDTSSAVFMLMKTWECDAYDGHVLLSHSVKTYGEEAGDAFDIKGVDALPPFQVSMKEDDITLDELLDILANKHGFDWGVDIPGKVVYVYPGK